MWIRYVRLAALIASLAGCRTDGTRQPPTSVAVAAARPLPPLSDAAIDSGLPVDVISEETQFRFHPDGTKTEIRRLTYRVLNLRDIKNWAQISATFRPWYESAPKLSARVTTPDGEVFALDPKTVTEAPIENEGETLSDARRIVAPLPALVAGALVEQTIEKREKKPYFAAGTAGRFYFGMVVPVRSSRLVLDTPRGLDFKYEVRGLSLEPQVEHVDGRRIFRFEVGPLLPQPRPTPFMPAEAPRYPYVAFSTVSDWAEVARRYSDLVERGLEDFNAAELVAGIDRRSSRSELVAALVDRLHATVRYAGVEFGERSIVPWPPSQTLARRFGDCKDKGALLIAMLRAVGLDGRLALLRSGFGEDIRPQLPGLEPFNHAIVFVPGERELWIDATAPFVPLGQLPSSVQGRQALVAAPNVTGLRRLPEAPAGANRYFENRILSLPEWGPVEVIERTLAFGSMERRLRAQFADSPPTRIRDSLERYVRSTYEAERLTSYQISDPKNLGVPFEIEVRADHAGVGFTSSDEAKVRLTNAIVFTWLPVPLREAALARGPDEPDPERRAALAALAARRADFVWPEPYQAQVKFQVIPPVGYRLRRLPDSRRLALGPGVFEAQYRRRDDGGVDAEFKFAVQRRRYTADEARLFVAALGRLWSDGTPSIHFDHEGARLLSQGKLREGIAYYRRLARMHPNGALHQARLAQALLKVNLGDAARMAAAKAVELQPESPYANFIRGWVLQHDHFGRPFRPGFDRAGAVAAYERVLRLDAEHTQARQNLAKLLEYDRLGRRYADADGVEAAIDNYRQLHKRIDDDEEIERSLLMALFRAGRCAEVSVLVRDTARSLIRDGLEVACAILLRGVADGVRVLGEMRLPTEARQTVIEATLRFLVTSRAYDLAREVALLAIPGASDPVSLESQVRTLNRLKPYERVQLDEDDPARVVQRLYEMMFDGRGRIDRYEALFAASSLQPPHGDALKASLQREFASLGRIQDGEMPHTILRDSVLSLTRFRAEGNDRTGYRIRTLVDGGADVQSVWFVVREGRDYKIRGGGSSAWLLGTEAMARAKRGRYTEAARWLDWGRGVWADLDANDTAAATPFARAWPMPDGRQASRARIRAAAALLAALGPGDAVVVRALQRSRADGRLGPEVRVELDRAEFLQFDELDDDRGRLRTAARIRAEAPGTELAHVFWTRALLEAGRLPEAEAAILARRKTRPDDRLTAEQLIDLSVRKADFETAQRMLRRQIDQGDGSARTFNNLAWLRLFIGGVDDEDLGLALRANSLSGFKNASQLHTLAALYAETGRAREAIQLLMKRLDLLGQAEPTNVDWYLLGRVHEHFELFNLAQFAYERVRPEPDERGPDSTHALTQRRLRGLAKRRRSEQI